MTRTQSTVMSSGSGAVGLILSLTKIQTNDEDAAAPGTTGRHRICRSQRYKLMTRMQASVRGSRQAVSLTVANKDTNYLMTRMQSTAKSPHHNIVCLTLSLTKIQINNEDAEDT